MQAKEFSALLATARGYHASSGVAKGGVRERVRVRVRVRVRIVVGIPI